LESLHARLIVLHESLDKELASHKRALTRVWEQQMVLREEMAGFKKDVQYLRSVNGQQGNSLSADTSPTASLPLAVGSLDRQGPNSNYVTQQEHEAAITSLREELQMLRSQIDQSSLLVNGITIQRKPIVADKIVNDQDRSATTDYSKATFMSSENTCIQEPTDENGASRTQALSNIAAAGNICFSIELDREKGRPVGAAVDGVDGETLRVEYIRPGLFQEWNEENPDYIVRAGDRIVGVNGELGNAKKLAEALTTRTKLRLAISRGGPRQEKEGGPTIEA